MKVGYRVYYYKNYQDNIGEVIHETGIAGNKISRGEINQSISEAATFNFELLHDHPLYNGVNEITGLVKVINKFDNEIEFYGRVVKQQSEMDSTGLFYKNFDCESLLCYLQDSTQHFQRVNNVDVKDYFKNIIDVHNAQVEPHKQFKIGKVTVKNKSDVLQRYIGYETTFETIKSKLIDKMGGFIVLRFESDGMYLDYLETVGESRKTPLRVGVNLMSARKELDMTNLITRLVPIGADKQDSMTGGDQAGEFVLRERYTIESVNNGLKYVEDPELVKRFGVIQRPMEWTEIDNEMILLSRAIQYMKTQKIALSSWNIEAVELYINNSDFEKFKLGNRYPIDNTLLSAREELQVIKKTIDVTQPETVDLTIGDDGVSLSKFQLQQREAEKSIEKLAHETRTKQNELAKQQNVAFGESKLQFELSEQREMLRAVEMELLSLEVQLKEAKDIHVTNGLNNKKNIAETKKRTIEERIVQINKELETIKSEQLKRIGGNT